MFQGLLDSNMAAYVTTAANAYESSWATYCPEFFGNSNSAASSDLQPAATIVTPSNSLPAASEEVGTAVSSSSSWGGWVQMLVEGLRYAQRLVIPFTVPAQQRSAGSSSSSAASSSAAAAQGSLQQQQQDALRGAPPAPQFFTCLGDLYSVAWMEDAEVSDLTQETLLQQYKSIKRRTSQNFTYEQGSHVMQYGALDIDKELAGDYQGMMHNGSVPPSPFPFAEWIEFEQQQLEMQQQRYRQGVSLLRRSGIVPKQQQQRKAGKAGKAAKMTSVLQRDADLLPLVHAAQRSTCPHKRAAAAAQLRSATAARETLEAAARAAAASLIKHAEVGHLLLANLGWNAQQVLPAAQPAALQALYATNTANKQQQQQLLMQERGNVAVVQLETAQGGGSSSSNGLLGDVAAAFVEALLGPLPGREGAAVVDSWECLRGMVQVRCCASVSLCEGLQRRCSTLNSGSPSRKDWQKEKPNYRNEAYSTNRGTPVWTQKETEEVNLAPRVTLPDPRVWKGW
jgi:hypothetical protein